MSESHEYCVILAGGTGVRFWPLSREDRPKQFLVSERDGKSFLRYTYDRMRTVFEEDHIYISTQMRYRSLIFEQLPDIPEDHLILEPYGRNTAPAIAFAAYTLLSRDPQAVMVVTPCDHVISDGEAFSAVIRKALKCAEYSDALFTLGIVPTSPNTNFGYVQVEGAWSSGIPVKARTFTEKPSPELAQVFLDSGEFLWNSGIFIWSAQAILEEMDRCCPEITSLWKGWEKELGGIHATRFVERIYTDSPNISIDYAVLEKSDNLFVLPADFGWGDIGTWNSFYEYSPNKDESGNLVFVTGDKMLSDVSGDIVQTRDSRKLTVVKGLKDFLVVDTDDVLLICPREEQAIKDTLSMLKAPGFEEYK